MIVGGQNYSHTFWVIPVRVANSSEVLCALGAAGFDATCRSSLIVVAPPDALSCSEQEDAPWVAETIFLPNGDHIPDNEWERMSSIIANVARLAEPYQRLVVALPCPATVPS
jgi:hypothetical protein